MPLRPPAAIRDLPMSLLRSGMRPRDPRQIQALVDAQRGPGPATYLPQNMGFSRWKTPPVRAAYGENVASVLSALEQQHLQLAMIRRGYYQPPLEQLHDAAAERGGDRLPQPGDNLDRTLQEAPLARQVIAADKVVTGGELNQLVADDRARLRALRDNASVRRQNAMAEVDAMNGELMTMLAGVRR